MTEHLREHTTAEAIVFALAAHGVDVAFGIPGVHNLALWEAARSHGGLEIVGVRHEQAAVYAADGVARQTRAPVAALTITGPGAANAAGAFGEAAACGSPVILIATEVAKRDRSARSSFGRVHGSPDQAAIFESLAKAVYRIRNAADVVPMMTAALRCAAAAPQGPVYVDVPTDLLAVTVPRSGSIAPGRVAELPPAPLDDLLAALERSARPLIWAGGGAATDAAADIVRQLSRRLGAPVITTFAGRGIVTASDEGWIGLPVHEPEVLELMDRSDLLLGLGSGFDGMNTRNWDIPFPPEFFSVNVAATHLVEEDVDHAAIVDDVTRAGTTLLDRLDASPRQSWAQLDVLRAAARDRMLTEMEPAATSMLAGVNAALARGDTVLADMAIVGYWTAGYAAPTRPRQLQYPVGWGTLGFALPAAIGAAWSARREGRRALVVCGDGGFMFAIGELATLREQHLPVTVLVVDDGGYGMLRFDQTVSGMEHFGVNLWVPDIAMVARSFDIPTRSIDAGDDAALGEALLAGDSESGPALVHVRAALHPPRTTSPRWRETQVVTAR